MENQQFIVYKHTNKLNGKIYIGLTKNIKRRWIGKGQAYSGSPLFFKALQKYGWENFEHEILFENLSEEEAKKKETELIIEYRSNQSKYGYNLTLGGECNIPNEEVKQKISITNKNNMQNGTKQKIKEALKDRDFKGENNPYFGKHHSQEIRSKMSQNQWFKKDPDRFLKTMKRNLNAGGPESKFAKKVIRLYDGKIYEWIKGCAEDNNLHVGTIYNHCNHKSSNCLFMFLNDFLSLEVEEQERLKLKSFEYMQNPNKSNACRKKIIQISTGTVFDSLKICCEKLNHDARTIIAHCKGYWKKGKPLKGRDFMYFDEYTKLTEPQKEQLKLEFLDRQNNKTKYNANSKPFVCLKDGQVHYSVFKAEKEHIAAARTIRNHCNGHVPKEKQLFMWLYEYDKLSEAEKEQFKK